MSLAPGLSDSDIRAATIKFTYPDTNHNPNHYVNKQPTNAQELAQLTKQVEAITDKVNENIADLNTHDEKLETIEKRLKALEDKKDIKSEFKYTDIPTAKQVQELANEIDKEILAEMYKFATKESTIDKETTKEKLEREDNEYKLVNAIRSGNISVVRNMLDIGVDVNAVGLDGWTPLITASCYGQFDVVKLLLESEANVDFRTPLGWTALMYACYNTSSVNIKIAKLLIAYGADVNAQNNNKCTPLSIARECNPKDSDIVKYFVDIYNKQNPPINKDLYFEMLNFFNTFELSNVRYTSFSNLCELTTTEDFAYKLHTITNKVKTLKENS